MVGVGVKRKKEEVKNNKFQCKAKIKKYKKRKEIFIL